MVSRDDIRLLTPEEQAERAAQVKAQEELERLRLLQALDQYEFKCERGGRPSIVLPPEVARRVLADVEAGHSSRAIARKYKYTPWAFSRAWLQRAMADGTLLEMAGATHLVAQNTVKKAPVQTAI